MAFLANITDKIRGAQMPYSKVVGSFRSLEEQKRVKHFQRLYDYYTGDMDRIRFYLSQAMQEKQFKAETLGKMQLPHIDVVRKIVNRTSLAYKTPAERYIVEEKPNENYQLLLESSNINQQAKTWNRLAKVLDTVYVAPFWRTDHIEYEIFPPHLVTIEEDPKNYLEPLSVTYQMESGGKTVFVYWSKEYNYMLDENGKRMPQDGNTDGTNPYGLLPFIPCRLRPCDNHWGEGIHFLLILLRRLPSCSAPHTIMQSCRVTVLVSG